MKDPGGHGTSMVKTKLTLLHDSRVVGRGEGKSWQSRRIMEETSPRRCPEALARNCLVSVPRAAFAAP